jgi:hypothetical protein
MSWALFKSNILKYANNPNTLPDLKNVANLWTSEYDAAVKRGYDTVNFVKVKQGNTKLMEELVYAALLKGQTSKQPYDLVGELGKAVQAYWTGATLNELPIPLIPSPGATVNISVTSNVVINVGTWSPIQQSAPVQTQPNPIKDDFEKYKESQKTFDEIFKTTIIVYDNRLPTPTQIKQQTLEYRRDLGLDETPGESDTSDEKIDETPKRKIDPVKGDKKLFDAVSNGIWPAKGDYGNFVVDIKSTSKQSWYNKGTKSFPLTKVLTTSSEINEYLNKTGGKDVRVWFEVNPEYLSKNCTKIEIPLASGGSSNIVVHKQLKEVVQPAIDKIIKQKLNQYIKSCSGGLAVRNVTNGTRLSNHSWGLAIDMNADIYPIGTKFGEDGIYTKQNKKFVKLRDFNEFDLGFLKVAKIFQNEGLTWLKNFDPMHVSIYE